MKRTFVAYFPLFVVLLWFNGFSYAQSKTVETNQNQTLCENDDLFLRMNNPEYANQILGAMWTLTHDYSDFKNVDEVLGIFQSYLVAFEKNFKRDCFQLNQLGGSKAFKDQLSTWLNHDDQAVRAFSAVVLGISGDKSYSTYLANLLRERKGKEIGSIQYDRGRAAIALGMIGAKEYTLKLVNLLKSKNEFDRAGAALGLGYLKAKKYAFAVRKLLKDTDENTRQIAKESLKMMEGSKSNE